MVTNSLTSCRGLKNGNDIFHILDRVSIGHHNGIGCFNHHQILDACCRHQARLTADVAVAGVIDDNIALSHIPRRVL